MNREDKWPLPSAHGPPWQGKADLSTECSKLYLKVVKGEQTRRVHWEKILGVPTAVRGRSFHWGDDWQCSCYFHDSKNSMVLEEHLFEKQGWEKAQMYIWQMWETLRVLSGFQFHLSWGTGQAQAWFILISVAFNEPCKILLLTVLSPTMPWCVGYNSNTGLEVTKLGYTLRSLHNGFAVQLSTILSLL